jgi:DNA-binding NarL/FixJ family response regulator
MLRTEPLDVRPVTGMRRPRLLLADDHALFVSAIERLLADECTIVGHVHDGRAVIAAAEQLVPDVILLDIGMPELNGLEVARRLSQILPTAKLVFLTMHEDPDLAAEAFRAGASAYLLKRSAATELSTAIREVMEGRSYVTPLLTQELLGSLLRTDRPSVELTSQQREILQLIAEGRSMKQVAAVLNVTPRTIAFHKYQMMGHLKVKTTAELIQYAVKHHIV